MAIPSELVSDSQAISALAWREAEPAPRPVPAAAGLPAGDTLASRFGAGADDPYLAQAVVLRERLAVDAVGRDQAGGRPSEQIQWLRDSGLVNLLIAREHGGEGQPWSTALRIVRDFAQVDGSVAHLYGYHFGAQQGLRSRNDPDKVERLWRQSAQQRWLWGNTANSFSKSLFGRREGEYFVLDGFRPFTSGSHVADVLSVAWEDESGQTRRFAVIPGDRAGITIEDDWDGIGQRQTGSGRVTFRGVRIHDSEVVGQPIPFQPTAANALPSRTLGALQQQSVLLNVFVGSAQGALLAARQYTLAQARPWLYSGVERHADDPWIQRQYGELFAHTLGATALADRAAAALDAAWAQGDALSAEQRGEAARAVASANAHAGQVALRVTREIFEVMGARSATRAWGFDRFWRNVRIHTLHNPAEYKIRNVGRWVLGDGHPVPGTFQ
ncbi:MAG: Dibenzothiophene desulfurization enzyme C [Paracidovorax wautersii]|uniref:Dibenzothiophene desulfurization enzyme C n=1 Tax=Paracidovorax wautersii TaxID=1177982 RepID=A0A7V8JR37_9BURK|nr:MAG: Dibenzothiophene desulfurization enzyme C [Paracidovorax wautersii]